MGVRWEEQVDELMWEKSGALEEGSAGKEGRWRLSSGDFQVESREVPGKLLQEEAEVIC